MKTRRTVIAMLAAGPAALLEALNNVGKRPPIESGERYAVVDDMVTFPEWDLEPDLEPVTHTAIFNENTREILDCEIVLYDIHEKEHRYPARVERHGNRLEFITESIPETVTVVAGAVFIGPELIFFTDQRNQVIGEHNTVTMSVFTGGAERVT